MSSARSRPRRRSRSAPAGRSAGVGARSGRRPWRRQSSPPRSGRRPPVDWAAITKPTLAVRLTTAASTFLSALMRWSESREADAENSDEEDALAGSEVTAVDTACRDRCSQCDAMVFCRAADARQACGRASGCTHTSTSASAINTGTIASKAEAGRTRSKPAPARPPGDRDYAQAQRPPALALRARAGSRSLPRPLRERGRRYWRRWRPEVNSPARSGREM